MPTLHDTDLLAETRKAVDSINMAPDDADDTIAGLAPTDETEIVAPIVDYPQTPTAWSLDDAPDDESHSWRRAAGWAVSILLAALVVAAAIATVVDISDGLGSTIVAATPTVMPASALPPIGAEPIRPPNDARKTADVQAPGNEPLPGPDYDARFIDHLRTHGAVIVDRDGALQTGHWVCRELRSGKSIDGVTNELVSHLNFPHDEAARDVTAAIAVYPNCP